jgi:hypothetical protein
VTSFHWTIGYPYTWQVTSEKKNTGLCNDTDNISECNAKVNADTTGPSPWRDWGSIAGTGNYPYWEITGKWIWTSSGPFATTVTKDYSQVAAAINGMQVVTALDDTGLSTSGLVDWMWGQTTLFMGSWLGIFRTLLPYILALVTIMVIAFFGFRAFRFMRH